MELIANAILVAIVLMIGMYVGRVFFGFFDKNFGKKEVDLEEQSKLRKETMERIRKSNQNKR